jgi:hypothetical protein
MAQHFKQLLWHPMYSMDRRRHMHKAHAKQAQRHSTTLHFTATLQHPRNNPVWHPEAVLYPVQTILLRTATIVPTRAEGQQESQSQGVEERQGVGDQAWGGPQQGCQHFREVVEVPVGVTEGGREEEN